VSAETSDDELTRLRPRAQAEDSAPVGYAIRVVEGPDAGKSWQIEGDGRRVWIGTSPGAEIQLTDREVSRRHAALELTEAGLRVVDLESTNGTLVSGVLIHDATLAGGEYVRMGATTLSIETADAAPPEEKTTDHFGRMLGQSPEMRRLYPVCEKLAASTIPVVIEGETGTGKELLCEALHEQGPRAKEAFVVFDCTSVSSTLMESALFGHERGAFTGATTTRPGVFELAHGGTLLIDEIGDLELALQAKLLRAVERSQVQRLGSTQWRQVDVRVIAATRRNLDRAVQDGQFREDLYFRLAVGRIELPPLRRRRGDVELLARHFFTQHGGTDRADLSRFLSRVTDHSWPGNVRELSNAVARHVALGDTNLRENADAPVGGNKEPIAAILDLGLPLPEARKRVVDELERRYVERVLALHDGHVGKAAAASGIARRYFELIRARHK
jgi:two-component system, NtrC family, response regulator HydG